MIDEIMNVRRIGVMEYGILVMYENCGGIDGCGVMCEWNVFD